MIIMAKVTARSLDGWKMQVSDGRHEWLADVSAKSGGADAGPAPFDHLLAALATCVCFITRRYAQTARIPVEAATVDVEGDWAKEPGSGQEFYQIKVSARYSGKLSDQDLQRLAHAADTCPVKRAYGGLIRVEVSVGKG